MNWQNAFMNIWKLTGYKYAQKERGYMILMNGKLSMRHKAMGALIICALLWSTSGFALKSVTTLDSMRVSGYRCLIAAVFLILVQGKPRIEKKNKWFWTGCVAYAVASYLIVQANALTTAANAIILQYIAPVFVCVFSVIFLHEKMRRSNFVVIGAVLIGLILFFQESLSVNMAHTVGNIVAVMVGFVMALQAISVCQVQNVKVVRSVVMLGSLLNFILCLPFMQHTPAPLSDYLWILFLGIFQLGLSYSIYSWAVNYLSPLEVILIPAIEPLANPVLTLLIRGEKMTMNTIAGGIIVVGSITVWSFWKEIRRKDKRVA
ncbi:EamA/RhaT family transporter [Lactonifactor longoviformis]|nr:EamA/RhaT family transporter [Lactonifactor longoviformis]